MTAVTVNMTIWALTSYAADTVQTIPGEPTGQFRRVKTPTVDVVPNVASIKSGGSIRLLALTHGGEAMRFSIDWQILQGGSLFDLQAEPHFDASISGAHNRLDSRPGGTGTVKIRARLRNYPDAFADIVVTITP